MFADTTFMTFAPCYLVIFASIVGFSSMWHAAAHQSSISRSVWYRGVVKFWFLVWATQRASHVQDQANAHNRSITHTYQCSMFFIQCTMFNVLCSMFNFKDQANAHNRSITHTYQCSMFFIQCTMFNVLCSMFNFKDQANAHNRSITHILPYLINVIFSPRTNSPEKYAITQSFHHSLIKIRFTQH